MNSVQVPESYPGFVRDEYIKARDNNERATRRQIKDRASGRWMAQLSEDEMRTFRSRAVNDAFMIWTRAVEYEWQDSAEGIRYIIGLSPFTGKDVQRVHVNAATPEEIIAYGEFLVRRSAKEAAEGRSYIRIGRRRKAAAAKVAA